MTGNGGTSQGLVSRRDALRKSAVAAGVVGVAWSAPKVEGLSLRPSYAAAQSGPVCVKFALRANRTASGGPSNAIYSSALPFNHPSVGARGHNLSAMSASGIGVNSLFVAVNGSGLSNCSLNIDAVHPAVAFTVVQMSASSRRVQTAAFGTFGAPAAVEVTGRLCCD